MANSPTPLTIDDLFFLAVDQNSNEETFQDKNTFGYVRNRTKNQTKDSIYKVTKTGLEAYTVEKQEGEEWLPMDNKSPRIKGIIKKFKQGDFELILN